MIFAVLFLWIICYQPLCSICIVIVLFKNSGFYFRGRQVTQKTAKIMSLENLCVYDMYIRMYIYIYVRMYVHMYMYVAIVYSVLYLIKVN